MHQHKLFDQIHNHAAFAHFISSRMTKNQMTKWPKNSVNKANKDLIIWFLVTLDEMKWALDTKFILSIRDSLIIVQGFSYYVSIQWIIKQFPHLKIGSRKVIDRGSAPIWHPGFYLKSADNQGNCCQWIQKEISQNGHRGNLRSIQSYTSKVL